MDLSLISSVCTQLLSVRMSTKLGWYQSQNGIFNYNFLIQINQPLKLYMLTLLQDSLQFSELYTVEKEN